MMSREHHRRRSPESSRRRRKERRDSREQLQSHPIPAAIPSHEEQYPRPHQQPYQPSHQQPPEEGPYRSPYQPEPPPARERDRDRGYSSSFSSTTSSSSTSSSLLNVSQPARRFGLGSFFSGNARKQRRRIKKKRSKILRFGNSSSSSVGSDLAYGRGYVDRRRSREFSPPAGQRPPARDSDPERPRPPRRAQTDEEIIELGRKFAELARQQNTDDLRAAGRARPSTLASAATALNQFRRTNSGNLNKGIGNSKPSRDSSPDDSDWESASSDDESGEDGSDNGLAYGSAHHLQSNSGRPSHLGASAQPTQPYSHDIPLNRKRSLVDPKLFGPINSLRGFVQTPCGFERVDRDAVVHDVYANYEPSVPDETVVSAETRPMQHVYPLPTSDPSRFDAGRGSTVSAHQGLTSSSRPDPVPIQQPKPIAPVYRKVFDSVDTDPKLTNKPPSTRAAVPTGGIGLPDAATNSPLSSDAAIGPVFRAARKAAQSKYHDSRSDDLQRQPERSGDTGYDSKHEKYDGRDALRGIPPDKSYDKDREATRNDEKERHRREKRESHLDRDLGSENLRRDKYHDSLHHTAKVEREMDDSRDDRKVSRTENRREKPREDQISVHEPKNNVPAPSDEPNLERPKGTIDPFQFQVADDAFPTPRYGTPMRPLTPVIMTVDREPNFSKLESSEPYERLSRKDSFERELRDAQNAYKAAEQATAPVEKAAFAAAAAVEITEARRKRSTEGASIPRDRSEDSSSSSRPKDPVLDDADRAYREARLARRIQAQEERSRSNSPDSVVDKWEDKHSGNAYRVTTPPALDQPKQKNIFDGPNADVRIDNVLEHPKELSRFRISESRRRSSTFPIFSARDPSAERERPMLNLVRPTPAPSPIPEKQQLRNLDMPPSTTEVDPGSGPAIIQDEVISTPSVAPSKAVTWGENQTKHYVIESPDREDDPYSGTKIITPTETHRSRTSKKSGWGAITAAIAGVGVGIAASSVSDDSADRSVRREDGDSKDPGQSSKRRPSLQFDSLYDDPPTPGPKPPSPRSSQMPGRFAEDPMFMANIAAGLEGSGFDPNIIIDDARFHHRDSPPGSNEPLGISTISTRRGTTDNDQDRGDISFTLGEHRNNSAEEKEISSNNSEIFSRLSKKERRRQEKAATQDGSDKSLPDVHDNATLPASDLFKEQKRPAENQTWEDDQVPGASSSVQQEPELITDVNVMTKTPPKKKKSKKPKKAIVIQEDSPHYLEFDPQQIRTVERPEDIPVDTSSTVEDIQTVEPEVDWTTENNDTKTSHWDPRAPKINAGLESTARDSELATDDSSTAPQEEWIAPSKGNEKIQRDSLVDESVPSHKALELSRESSYAIVEPGVRPAPADEWNLSRKGKKEGSASTETDSLPRSRYVSKVLEELMKRNAGDKASELVNKTDSVDDWDNLVVGEKEPERSPSPSRRTSLIEDSINSPKDVADSFGDLPRDSFAATEEDWVDLPKKAKKKKKKSKRDAATREDSPSASPGAPRSVASVLKEDSFTDLPSRPNAPEPIPEDEEATTGDKSRSSPSGFPKDTDSLNERQLPDVEREFPGSQDKNERNSSSFFGRLKSSIGFSDGKEQSQTPTDGANSFLDNAGALGTSAGLTNSAIALALQRLTGKAPDTAAETSLLEETQPPEWRSSSPETELIDPEIVEREIRPAIDPTYGDLLPLPPSRPSTPLPDLDESIPPLPESRPGTPEDERERRLLAQKSAHNRRRSDIPLRVKTPSQSAIPIQFRLGQRTTPGSPSVLKQSPSASPTVTAAPETGSASKSRARPMSWESSKSFMPLFLVERSRESVTPPASLQEEPHSSDLPDAGVDVSSPPSNHTVIPHDDLNDNRLIQEYAAQPLGSPELPPLKPVEEPESPTPKPDPIDAVTKNRSSYLLYSSPPGPQNPGDGDASEGSPSLRAAKRQMALDEVEEDVLDKISGSDLLVTAAAGLATGALAADALVEDDARSPEFSSDTKDSTVLGIALSGKSTEPRETTDTDEIGVKDNETSVATISPAKKSKKGKKGKNKSRDTEPVAETLDEEASVKPAPTQSSDTLESTITTDEKEEELPSAKLSKKDKKKKKKEQSRGLSIEGEKAVETSAVKDQEDEFVDAPATVEQAMVEPQAQQAEADVTAEAHMLTPAKVPETPAESSIETSATAPAEATVEAPIKAPIEASVEVPSEILTELPIEAPTEAFAQTPSEILGLSAIESPVENTAGAVSAAPIVATVGAPVEIPLEAPVKIPDPAATEPTVDTPTHIANEALAESTIKAPDEAPAGTAVKALAETPAGGESVVTSKKGKKKKRKSQAPEPEVEVQPLTVPQDEKLEETVLPATIENASVDSPILTPKEMPSEQEASSTTPETAAAGSIEGEQKKGNKSAPSEEEPITAAILDMTTSTEHVPSIIDQVHSEPREPNFPDQGSEDVRDLPAVAEDIPSERNDAVSEYAPQVSSTAEDIPATTSKKSKKKKKKAAQVLEPQQQTPTVADSENPLETVEEVKQSEAELRPSKASDATEALSSLQATTASIDSPLNTLPEAVEPLLSNELNEELELASETPQAPIDIVDSALIDEEPSEGKKLSTEGEGGQPIQAGEPSSVSLQEQLADASHLSPPNDENEPHSRPDALSGDEIQHEPELTDVSKNPLIEDDVKDLNAASTSNNLLDIVGESQPSASDQIAGDEPTEAIDELQEAPSKKKAKKKKKKQSVSNMSDVQEPAIISSKTEYVHEKPAEDALSTDHATEPLPIMLDTALVPEDAKAPVDTTFPDTSSSIKDSETGKEGGEDGRDATLEATEKVEGTPKPAGDVLALEDQVINNTEASVAPSEAEPTADDPRSDPITPTKKSKKKGKKNRQSADLSAPTEAIGLSSVEPDSAVAENVADTAHPDSQSTPLATTQIVSPTEKEKPEPDIEAYPFKKQQSAEPELVNSDTIPETADSSSTQQDAFLGQQSSDPADSLVEPVVDIPDPDVSQVVDKAEDFSSSPKKAKKNRKRQNVTLMEDEDTSDLPGPIPEMLFDLKDIHHIPEQVKEDDADVSSASTSTKKTKKEKKKKRQSVQFVEPIEETREIPAESNDKIVAPEISAEPEEEPLDSLNAPTIPSEPASSPLSASYNLDQVHDAHTVQDSSETPFLNLDHSSVPVLADGDVDADQPQGVSSPPVPPTDQPQGEALEQPNQGEVARADQIISSQPQGDIETSIQTHSGDHSEIQKPINSLPEVVESDIKSDAPTTTNDQALSEDKSRAEVMPAIEDSIPGTVNDDSPSVTKKSKKDKKKRKGKSLDSQESASDPAPLITIIDDGVNMGEDKETSSAVLLSEFPTQSSKDVELKEPATVEHTLADKQFDEEPAAEQSITEQVSAEKSTAEEQDVEGPVAGESTAEAPSVQESTTDQPAVENSTATEQPGVEQSVAESTAEEQIERSTMEDPSVENAPPGEKAVDDLHNVDNSAGERTSAEGPGIDAPTTDSLPVEERAAEEPISEEPTVETRAVEVPAIENLIAEERVIDTPVEAPFVKIPLVEDSPFEEPVVKSAQDDVTPETTAKKSKKGKKKGKKANKDLHDEPVQLSDVAPVSGLDDGATSQDSIVNMPQSTLLEKGDEASTAFDISKPPVDEQGLSSEVPPAALPSAPNDQTQSSQDNQIITQISHPENEATPIVGPTVTDVGTEELAALTTPEPEHFLDPPASEAQSETTTRKSKKDKKKKKRESQLLVDQLGATQNATTDPIVGVESPVIGIEQTTSPLPDASEIGTTSAPNVEFHTPDGESHPGTELVSVTPTVPASETPIELPKPSEPQSDQLPIASEVSPEVAEQDSTKKDEAEQASSWENEASLVEPEELAAEKLAAVQISESADLSIPFSPEELKDDGTINYASAEETKKDKKKELASWGDEAASLEPPMERVQPASDNLEQNDAIPLTQPDNSQTVVSSQSEDTQVDDVVNAGDSSSLTPTKQSKKGKKKKKSTSSADIVVTSALQPEPVQTGPDSVEQNHFSLPTESESPSVEEPPKIEDTEDISALVTTKKSKKKKAVDGQEEILREVQTALAGSMSGEGEQSDVFIAVPAQTSEENIAVESVSKEADTVQDKTIPPGETVLDVDISLEDGSAPKVEDAASNETPSKTESTPRDEYTTQIKAVVQEDREKDDSTPTDDNAPKVQDDSRDETVSKDERTPGDEDATQGEVINEDSGLRDDDNAPRSEPILDNKAVIKDETTSQDKAVPDSQPSDESAPTKKSKKNKKKKQQSISQVDELTEGILADSPVPAGTADLVQPVGEETLVQPAASEIHGDLTELTEDKKDGQKRGVSSNDEVPERQPATEPPLAAADNTTHSVEDEAPAPESSNDGGLADLGPVEKDKKSSSPGDEVSEEKLSGGPATGTVDPVPNEFPASQSSNEDSAAQPVSTKKSKKDKKKKNQMASQEEGSTQQAFPVEDLPEAQKDLPQDGEPQQVLTEDDLSREEGSKEELLQEEPAGEVTQDTPISEEPGQISLSHESPSQAPSEPATALRQEEAANEETTEIDGPPKSDIASHTPTKKSKKDKKKRQSGSSGAEVISQVEAVQSEDNQPLAVAETVFESELPRESEAPVAVIPAENKEDDITPLTPTKKSKKEKKKKKQARLESNLTEETVETSTEVVPPDTPSRSEMAEAEVSEPNIYEDSKAIDDLPSTKSEEGEKEKQSTVLEDDSLSQLASGQEPDISTNASTEISPSEGLLELAPGEKKKKDKKKKRASVLENKPEPEPEPERRGSESTAGPVEAAELTKTDDSRWLGEQPSVQRTQDQNTIFEEIKTLGQDKGEDSSRHLDASAQELDTTFKAETASTTQPGEAVENIASALSIAPTETVPTYATQELSSPDQITLRAAETELVDEPALETAPETDNANPTPSQEPETVQLEEATPKVDDGMDIVSSKKSKKDKKKKKRASQVSWELGPEAEIEDLPEQQQPERTLDEQPITTDTKEIGDGGETVKDPFSESASDEKAKKQKRQKQMDSEPEPNSEAVEEPKPLPPTEQGQLDDMLPDHQSLAGDTQTSLKHSTDLDDTLLETTFSNTPTKKKDSRLDRDADPATLDASEPAADPFLVDRGITEKHHELVGTPLAEASEAMHTEAHVEDFHEIVSAKQSKKDKRKAKKQSTTENPEHEIDTGQLARSSSQISLHAANKLTPVESASVNFEQSNVSYEQDLANEQSRNLLDDEVQPPVKAAQAKEGSSQVQSIKHDTNTEIGSMSIDIMPSHDTVRDGDDLMSFPSTLVGGLDKAAEEVQTQESKDTADHSQVFLQEASESSTTKSKEEKRKAKAVQTHDISDADPNTNTTAHLQSWDWSNIDRKSQPDTAVSETVSVSEDLSQVKSQVTTQPGHALHTTSQHDQTEISNTDTTESTQPELVKPETESRAEPSIERSLIARKKSKKDKRKKKRTGESESEELSEAQIPQTQPFDSSVDLQVAAPSSPKAPEIEMIDKQDDGRTPSGTKSETGNKRSNTLILEEAPLEPQITLNVSRDVAVPQQQSLDEISPRENQDAKAQSPAAAHDSAQPQVQTAVINDAAVEIGETGQFVASEGRPQTPLLDGQVSITLDMSPAQLSSDIEHDRPFDQSTQPDKKLRTLLVEDDTMLPEPLSAMAVESIDPIPEESKPQTTGTIVDNIHSLVEEPDEQRKKNEVVDASAGEPIIVTHVELDPMNIDTLQASSNEDKSKDLGFVQGDDKVMTEESSIAKSKKKTKKKDQMDENQNLRTAAIIGAGAGAVVDVIEKLGESKKVKEKRKPKQADETIHKEDGAVNDPEVWENSKRKTLEGAMRDADSADFWTGPSTEAEARSKEAYPEIAVPEASEEVPKLAQHQDHSVDENIAESPVVGREMVPEFSRSSRAEETGLRMKEASTTEAAQISLDDKTSVQQDARHQSTPRFGGRDVSEEPSLTLVTPSRTPSALDYRRSLPPVEEETHEDLQKELQSDLEKKAAVESEANRDSGFITGSPNPQRHSLGLDDSGQRDSGVHMRGWTEETRPGPEGPEAEKAGSEKSNTGTLSNPTDKDSGSQTPQPQERRSRRSVFDSEPPKLDTPTQGRGWERGATPEKPGEEKPGEEEPMKRTTTPLTSRATKYQDLALSRDAGGGSGGAALQPHTPQQQTQRSVSDNVSSGNIRRESTTTPRLESVARRSTSSNTSISRLRTPELSRVRPESPGSHSIHSIRSLRSSGANTPPLRRVDRRMSGDLRALSHNSSTPSLHSSTREPREPTERDTAKDASSDRHALSSTITPIANEGRVRAKDMTDVYDGYGEGRIGSPRSPTRPPSMRRRQSMQVLELESKVEQLLAENRALADARARAEQSLNYRNTSAITDRDAEIESLKASLQWLQNEVTRLTEVNEGLQSANSLLALQHNEKYTRLESKHNTATRELEEHRGAKDQHAQTIQAKDAEIQELRNQLEAAKEQIREMKQQILASKPPDADFLRLRDEDHFDHRCQQLCSHVQQWVLRFSKFSDMRACRLTNEINDEKIIDRLDNAVLDGSDVDDFLSDRVARRDIFMSMTMNMIWEFVFTRYLFGMDREQRQKLKSLEKLLTDVGPPHAVRQWRAVTLTLLSRRPAFGDQRNQDTEAVVQAILQTLSMILPPPSNLETQIQSQLRRVMREAVDLSIEMRTQRAEYMMLPPLQPEYDANGELTQTVTFNAALMNERSGDSSTTNEAYEAQSAIVRCVLFPLVVKKGDDNGVGDDEIVVSPAQVLVAKARRSAIRMVTPSSDAGGASLVNYGPHSNVSVNMQDAPLTPDYV